MPFTIDDVVTTVEVALDGVPRVARGVQLAALPLDEDVDVAPSGRWVDEETHTSTLHEKTFVGADIPIEGTG